MLWKCVEEVWRVKKGRFRILNILTVLLDLLSFALGCNPGTRAEFES